MRTISAKPCSRLLPERAALERAIPHGRWHHPIDQGFTVSQLSTVAVIDYGMGNLRSVLRRPLNTPPKI